MNAIMDNETRHQDSIRKVASAMHVNDDDDDDAAATDADGADDSQQKAIEASARPTSALRRQPTKYPHGLGISVLTIADGELQNYSRASTLRSSWDRGDHLQEFQSAAHDQRKYRLSMISNSEHLSELQVRRYKYPLTGNYYLDTQEVAKSTAPFAMLDYLRRFCKWKFVRWPIIFVASVLLFFGFITYCIWLHDVSVARERYLQRARFAGDELEYGASTNKLPHSLPTTTERGHPLQESTILRAIGTRSRQRPKEQKLTTLEYTVSSKGTVEWSEKERIVFETTTIAATTPEEPEPFNGVRLTSGHQNSFGIPIEEDQRISKLMKGFLQPKQQEPSTTVASVLTKISPTIPPVPLLKPTTSIAATRTTVQENGCYSTSLPMCRGVLDYDLTYNFTTQLSPLEAETFEQLISSNCSARALEFVCATLEPECRPSHIGVLPPCRRICKAILEACSIIISNSDVLSATFDCNFYPDSSDPHKCEDPTRRREYCYDNEFACYDRSCIPAQWQCDNIKDCPAGEDEDSCLLCDHQDEFRCRSNEKCIPDNMRCDSKYDCFDGSDEEDCEEYSSAEESTAFDEAALNSFPRIFSYASFLSPNQSNENLYTYITAATNDETGTKFEVHEVTNRTSGVSNEEVTNNVPGENLRGFVNFRDSKEIMMTSDSENKFKYSAARSNRTAASNKLPANTTPLRPAASQRIAVTTEAPKVLPAPILKAANCAPHELRCVSGKCITVAQLCDKKIDCPDGADELMCVYKERSTTTARNHGPTTMAARTNKRTIRTTIKRKAKT